MKPILFIFFACTAMAAVEKLPEWSIHSVSKVPSRNFSWSSKTNEDSLVYKSAHKSKVLRVEKTDLKFFSDRANGVVLHSKKSKLGVGCKEYVELTTQFGKKKFCESEALLNSELQTLLGDLKLKVLKD